jgi:hypothetical protein
MDELPQARVKSPNPTSILLVAALTGLATYAGYIGFTWLRYGKRKHHTTDPILDIFMPVYEVHERHTTRVHTPANHLWQVALETNIEDTGIVRALILTRETILGGTHSARNTKPLLEQMTGLGWNLLAEIPGQEIVMGAATKPWEPNPVFLPIPPNEFRDFNHPGFVKIIWTLRAEPDGPYHSIAISETRVTTTSPAARATFRRYWAFLSPGILLIRHAILLQLKYRAECPGSQLHSLT